MFHEPPDVSHAPHVLAVDMGSSSVRAAVVDGRGVPVDGTAVRLERTLHYDISGAAEIDPDQLLGDVVTAIDAAVAAARASGTRIDAVASDSMWHGVCGVDEQRSATFPVLTWADRRAAAALPTLRRRVDDLVQHQRTGARLHWLYPAAKILWVSEHHRDAFDATSQFISPGEFVYLRLLGTTTCSISMASGTGLFDQQELGWDAELLAAVGIDERRLSEISDSPGQGLVPPWSRRWPELAAIPWFPTVGDGATSSIGAGCDDASRLALMVGTTGALRLVTSDDPGSLPGELWCYRLDRSRRVLGGALSDGGNLVAWMRSVLQLPERSELEALMAGREPGEHGLTVLPTLAGERSPGWSDEATGVISGLTHATRPVDLFHAMLEATALRFALIARSINTTLPAARSVVATGAAMRSAAWRQIMADALGMDVTASAVAEASQRGTALLAQQWMGARQAAAHVAAPVGDTATFSPPRHEVYKELLARQDQLARAVAGA